MFVNKNCPNDLRVGCLKLTNLASICELEFNLTKELDTEFVDVIKCELFSNIHDTLWICFQMCRCLKFIVFCYMVVSQIYESLWIGSQASQFHVFHNYKTKQTTFINSLGSIRHFGSLRETLFTIIDDFFLGS
jgi:hypothetical protein